MRSNGNLQNAPLLLSQVLRQVQQPLCIVAVRLLETFRHNGAQVHL
jgi:hypothetical protein